MNTKQLHSITKHETEINNLPSGIDNHNVLKATTDCCNGQISELSTELKTKISPNEFKNISLPNENDKQLLVCPDSMSKGSEIADSFISLCNEPISDGAAKFVPKTEIFKLDLPAKINSLDCQIKIENFEDQHMMGELLSDLKPSTICGTNENNLLKTVNPTTNKQHDPASLEIKQPKPSQDCIHDIRGLFRT